MKKTIFRVTIITILIGGFIGGTLLASAADDRPTSSLPLSRLFTQYDEFLQIAAGSEPDFNIIYKISSSEVSPDAVVLSFTYDGKDFEISPAAGGELSFRPTLAMLAADPTVSTNQPRGSLSVNIMFELDLPREKVLQVALVHGRVHAVWQILKDFAGALSFFAPSHTKLTVGFEDTCDTTGWSVGNNDQIVANGHSEGRLTLDFSQRKIRNSQSITFECSPIRFLVGDG